MEKLEKSGEIRKVQKNGGWCTAAWVKTERVERQFGGGGQKVAGAASD